MQKLKAKDFTKNNNWCSFLWITFDWILIIGTAWFSIVIGIWWFYILAVWFIGSRMIALAEVYGHDSIHYNLFENHSWNRSLDFLWFIPLFENWDGYRTEHMQHHTRLLSPKDPAWQDYRRWGLLKAKGRARMYWIWFVRPFLFFDTLYILTSIWQSLKEDKRHARRVFFFWTPVLAIFTATGTLHILALYWFVPFLWCYPAFLFWGETGEHFGVVGDNTRNSFGFFEWLFISPRNDRYHYIHHKYPKIPWWRLKAASKALLPLATTPASRGFIDLFREVRDGNSSPDYLKKLGVTGFEPATFPMSKQHSS